jgi:organic radical activating enzyme
MNTQKPVKQSTHISILSIIDIRYTIQGEGPFSGRPAVFVRLASCNIACTWCDTEYTKDSRLMEMDEVLHAINSFKTHPETPVVITGGEPFNQYAVAELARTLLAMGYTVQMETNGMLSVPDFPWDDRDMHIVVSPKTKFLHKYILRHACYYNYVIREADKNSANGLPMTETQQHGGGIPCPPPHFIHRDHIYLSPLDNDRLAQNTDTAVYLCKKFGYILNVQMHNVINVK